MVGCIVQAQMPQLLPKPQKVSFTGKYVKAGVPVREVLIQLLLCCNPHFSVTICP